MISARTRFAYLVSTVAIGAALLATACSSSPNTATDPATTESETSAAAGTAPATAATEVDSSAATGEPCADRDAGNPTLRQVYDGAANLLTNTAIAGGSSDAEVEAIRQGNSADSALAALPPELAAQQEQILTAIPEGGYARYVQSVCEVEESFEGVPTSTSTPWAAAFDGLTACSVIAQFPSSERDSYASSMEEGLRMGSMSEAIITYSVTKATAARAHLCPQ